MAGAWKIYTRAKRYLGTGANAMTGGGVTLGAGVFKMALHNSAAGTNIAKVTNGGIILWSSIGNEVSARGGYVAGGRNIAPAAGKWSVGASVRAMKFYYTTAGLVFTANGSTIQNIKYAVIRTSMSAAGGRVLCFCTLTATAFNLTSPNTLTIIPNAAGLFALA